VEWIMAFYREAVVNVQWKREPQFDPAGSVRRFENEASASRVQRTCSQNDQIG
jgi:hypothetical protein